MENKLFVLTATRRSVRKYTGEPIDKKSENIVKKTFIQMLESLGYDVELAYVKREEK